MIRIEPFGVQALLLTLVEQPDEYSSLRIARLANEIAVTFGDWIVDLVPGWTTLVVHYDLLKVDLPTLQARLTPLVDAWRNTPVDRATPRRQHEIPIWYAGPDLAEVAERCGFTVDEVIQIHSETEYHVGAIGFVPGYAYMGGLDARLALPRRASPRALVPAGTLAIAERQTGIYPQDSPGGWNLIGRSAFKLFDPHAEPPCPLALGDRVRFVPVDESTYRAQGGEV